MSTPTLAIEPPRPDTVVHWSIAQILSRESSDSPWYDSWEHLLEEKRSDTHYPDVLESIRKYGFIRPLNASIGYLRDPELQLADGHHRLAAAIELGMETVPVYITEHRIISDDSGTWTSRDPIDTDPSTCGSDGWF